MTALLPDRSELDRFIDVLFRHCDPDAFLILKAYFHDGEEEPVFHARGVRLGDSERGAEVERWAGVAAAAGRPAAFCPPVCTFRNTLAVRGYWAATRQDVANGPAISEDADKAPQATRAALVALLGPPTLEVASGGVWIDPETGELQDKLHLHWRLTAPTRTPEDHKRLERARRLAAELTGADRTNVPLSHPLRWAGAVHNKGEPRHARIVAETDHEIDLDAALKALEKAWGDRPVPEGDGKGGEPEAEWGDVEAALAIIPNTDRTDWHAWKEVAMATHRATAGGGLGLFERWSAKREDKHDPAGCELAWEQVERSPPDRIGFGSLVHRAREAEPGWVQPSRRFDLARWFEAITEPLFGDEGVGRNSTSKDGAYRLVTAADLKAMAFAPVRYVVPGYLAEGCTILAGAPKIGKSWLVYEWAIAKATGGVCLGNIVTPDAEDVLYLALEDNLRRLKSRMERLLRAGGEWPSRLTFATTWPRANEGGLDKIRDWARSVERPRLVIIDVLQAFRPPVTPKDNAYAADYNAVRVLTDLAAELGVALVAVLHTRKARDQVDPFDRVSGTLGLSGAADTALILDRDGNGVTLYGRGRDIPEIESAVSFDKETCRWFVQGKAAEVHQSDARKAVTDVLLVTAEPLSPVTIAEATGQTRGSTKTLLFRMFSKGEVLKTGKGLYVHPSRTDLLKPS